MSEVDEHYLHHLRGLFESSEETFHEKIFDFFPDIIYVYDTDSRKLRYVNKRITDVLGFSYDDIKTWDNDFNKIIFKDDVELVRQELDKFESLRDEDSHSYRCRFNLKEGDWMHFNVIGKVLRRNDAGKVMSLLLVAQDIHEQIQSSEDLRGVRELAEDNEELLHFGNWNWNAATNVIKWSRGMYILMDYSPDVQSPEITLDFYLHHIHESDRASFLGGIESAAKNKDSTFELKYKLVTHQQQEKIFYSKAKVIYDAGKIKNVIGITRDIREATRLSDELSKYEHELEQKIIELDRSNKELEDFAYAASHDLQEPLRKIATLSDRLEAKFGEVLLDEGKKYLERIQLSIKGARFLIDSLMEFSRISHDSKPFSETDLNTVLQEVKADLELKIEETQTVITATDLPTLEISPLQLRQLFSNIILNSMKFKKAAVIPEIKIRSKMLQRSEIQNYHLNPSINYYEVTIEDNGIGFEREYEQTIFQMFHRLHGKSEYPGAGIGLTLCKKIVEHHNGVIFAKGNPDSGATFTIILPEKQS
jgi:PAS domain S-box-containing protein